MSTMTREEILKNIIVQRHKSVLAFAKETGIPESSIRNIFTRGIDSVNAGTLVEICKRLGIDAESLMGGAIEARPNPQKEKVWQMYLDIKNEPTANSGNELVSKLLQALENAADRRSAVIGWFAALSEEQASQVILKVFELNDL